MDVTSFGPFDAVICPCCSAEIHVKTNFGTYRLEQKLAIGGMSVIFAGRDTTLDRRVAIKVLNEEYCNDEVRIESFENEARLTAQVSHPNVVKVYAVGRAYGRSYLVMELLKGKSFEHIINKRGAIPENEVLDIGLQVGAGLRAAKNSGMIHRDVKPGNVLIDEKGHARLIDFGLALITQDGWAQAPEIWATPYYVPPEALKRGIEDFRSDIYAFGASLYHALTGRPPFQSTTTSNSILRRAKQTIPRLCKVAPWISPATGEVIDRMMAFHPEHRWSSYAQVLKAFESAKKSLGEKAVTPMHCQRPLKRRKQKSYFGLVFTLMLVGLCTGLALWKPWERSSTAGANNKAPSVDLNKKDPEIFNPGGDPDDELFVLWDGARDLVRQQKYGEAANAFIRLSEVPTLAGMPQVWSSFEAAVSFSLDGQPARARQLHAMALTDFDNLSKERSQQKRFRRYAELLSGIPPPLESDLPKEPKDIIEWMALFTLALKQWDQGQWDLALPSFSKVRGASLPDGLEWFRLYQNIADIHLADGVLLTRLKDLDEPVTVDDTNKLIASLGDAINQLQTKGRARYNLQARQDHLSRVLSQYNETSLTTSAAPNWKKYQASLKRSARKLRFDDLRALLENPPPDASPETLWAWNFLHQNALSFIKDLASLDDWSAHRKDGLIVKPISGNINGLRLPDGSLIPWSQLKLSSLLEEHVNDDIHAIAFAWLAGLTSKAEEMAEELAKYDDEFRQNWRRVVVGLNP